ncbi:MAG: hemerythrin domain-containing protein [Rudaea sp.]
MKSEPVPPTGLRPLGRSRTYARDDLPKRLTLWHAPRANRWEHLCVSAGRLHTQWLEASGVAAADLQAGESRWIAPGTRWRVTQMHVDARFELQIHAADALPVDAPQPLRAALLDAAERVGVDDAAAFHRLIDMLAPGEARLLQGRCDCTDTLRAIIAESGLHWFWHPLYAGADGFTTFIACSAEPIGLLEYLGRDHAVIEAVLAGALRGDIEHTRWLQATLARHLAIEERLLFPAYLNAGGRESWIRGLNNEHVHLRRHLAALSKHDSARRFLLLLDGHDEKEEQIVYPDILARLGAGAAELTRSAMFLRPDFA